MPMCVHVTLSCLNIAKPCKIITTIRGSPTLGECKSRPTYCMYSNPITSTSAMIMAIVPYVVDDRSLGTKRKKPWQTATYTIYTKSWTRPTKQDYNRSEPRPPWKYTLGQTFVQAACYYRGCECWVRPLCPLASSVPVIVRVLLGSCLHDVYVSHYPHDQRIVIVRFLSSLRVSHVLCLQIRPVEWEVVVRNSDNFYFI